jgi:hypothetical protein
LFWESGNRRKARRRQDVNQGKPRNRRVMLN